MASARFILGVVLSAGVHVLAYAQMSHAKARVAAPKPPIVIEVDTSVPPPPPPPPKEEAPAAKNEPAPIAKSEKPIMKPSATPPPAAAQAGKILAAADDGPADFTMVQGTGIYAGGITSSTG